MCQMPASTLQDSCLAFDNYTPGHEHTVSGRSQTVGKKPRPVTHTNPRVLAEIQANVSLAIVRTTLYCSLSHIVGCACKSRYRPSWASLEPSPWLRLSTIPTES